AGREDVELQVVGEGIQRRYAAAVDRGHDVTVRQTTHGHERTCRGNAGHALHRCGRITIAGLQHGLSGDVIDAGRGVDLHPLEVCVAGAYGLALHHHVLQLCALTGQNEVDDHHFVFSHTDLLLFGFHGNEGHYERHLIAVRKFQGVIAVEVRDRCYAQLL